MAAAGVGGARGDVGGDVEDVEQQMRRLHVHPVPPIVYKPVAMNVDTSDKPLVYLSLRITGEDRNRHIKQIAAQRADDDTFSCFVLPIEQEAQGNPAESVGIREALNLFRDFLGDRPVVVVGHNIKAFDCLVLLNEARACDMVDWLQDAVHCFVDTLPLFLRVNPQLDTLASVCIYYLGRNHDSHDAREDARALQEIVDTAEITRETLSRHSFTLNYIIEVQDHREQTERLLETWRPLVQGNVVSLYIAEKAASSGLSFDDVRRAFAQAGEAGARRVLTERTAERKARVTNWTQILDSICHYLSHEQQ